MEKDFYTVTEQAEKWDMTHNLYSWFNAQLYHISESYKNVTFILGQQAIT